MCLNVAYLLVSPLSRVNALVKITSNLSVLPSRPAVVRGRKVWLAARCPCSVLCSGDPVTAMLVTARNHTRELPVSPVPPSPQPQATQAIKKSLSRIAGSCFVHFCFPWCGLRMLSATLIRGVCNCSFKCSSTDTETVLTEHLKAGTT